MKKEKSQIKKGETAKVIKLLEKNYLKWWINFGTLLGIIREGKLLEWDKDIDISILYEKEKLEKFISELKNKNISFEIREIRGKINNIKIFPKAQKRKIDFNIYYNLPKKDYYFCPVYSQKKDKKTKIYIWFRRFIKRIKILKLPYRIISKNKSSRKIVRNIFQTDAFWKMPKKFLKKIEKDDKFGLNIPCYVEEYLEYRYGIDWKIPNPNWTFENSWDKYGGIEYGQYKIEENSHSSS